MDDDRLREKLARIEALHAGAATDGERVAGEAFHRDSSEAEEVPQPPRLLEAAERKP